MRTIRPAVILTALGLAVPVAGASTAGATAPAVQPAATVPTVVHARAASPPRPAVYARRVVRHTNRDRVKRGRHRVRVAACLKRYAQRSANRIARSGELTHQNLRPVLRACGGWKVGENIAYGYRWPRHVERAWMDSPGHRANILEPRYRRIGVGVRRDGRGVVWVSQVFAYRR